MSEQQPEYVWAFPPEKRRGGRGWLTGALAAVAVVIAIGVALMLIRPWEGAAPAPTSTPSPSATASASPTPTATPTATPTVSPTPTATAPLPPPATATPPAQADPELPVFRGKVQPLLDDAARGLSFASDSTGDEGVQLVDQLQGDAERLSDAVAPRSIAQEWANRVVAYGTALDRLRTAFETGAAASVPLSAAESALKQLQELVDG